MAVESGTVISPGRVNLMGEHVDYNDGLVLPAAIDRNVTIHFSRRNDRTVHLKAIDFDSHCVLDIEHLDEKNDINGNPLPTWAMYPAGVIWKLLKQGYQVEGFDAEYSSTIPIGAGLSSSAAVEVGFAVTCQSLFGWEMDRLTLAQVCQQAEIEYAGVNCGLMDQFACANGVKDHAVLLDTRSLASKPVPIPTTTAIVIADSNTRRSLATSAYNQRRKDCESAVAFLHQRHPEVNSLRDVSPQLLKHYARELPTPVYRHARHVVEEIARVDQAIRELELGDAAAFGQLMFATHRSLRDYFEVSREELDLLVNLAAQIPGCLGARLTGAGFGGCTVNLVQEDKAESFVTRLADQYKWKTGLQADVFITHASQGAHLIH
jgi:galactokinase